MIIDSHSHVILPTECQLKQVDDAGIDRTVLFCTSVHPEAANDSASFELEMKHLSAIVGGQRNVASTKLGAIAEQASIITDYPSRFIGFGWAPIGQNYNETASWVEKYVIANHFTGLGEFTPGSGEIQKLLNVFSVASDLGGLPIWVHAFFPLTMKDILELAELARNYPAVPVIVGHLGGVHWLEVIKLAKEIPNLFMDLSASFTAIALKMAILELPERCLFGVDAPYGAPFLARQAIERVCPDAYVRERVLGDNIDGLLKISY